MNIKKGQYLTHKWAIRFLISLFSLLFVLCIIFVHSSIDQQNRIMQLETQVVILQKEIELHRSTIAKIKTDVDVKHSKGVKVKITAYTPSKEECDDDPFITASNKRVRPGQVAVSRDLFFEKGFTFGKKIYIENHGIFVINDLMNKRHKHAIDIVLFDKGKAVKFGVKKNKRAILLNS